MVPIPQLSREHKGRLCGEIQQLVIDDNSSRNRVSWCDTYTRWDKAMGKGWRHERVERDALSAPCCCLCQGMCQQQQEAEATRLVLLTPAYCQLQPQAYCQLQPQDASPDSNCCTVQRRSRTPHHRQNRTLEQQVGVREGGYGSTSTCHPLFEKRAKA